MMTTESKNIGICPECGAEVRLKKTPYVGQAITCRHCDSVLEVISRFPLELDWAEASWDDDFNDTEVDRADRRKSGR